MDPLITLPLGVVVERREIENVWQSHSWRPVAVIPGAPKVEHGRLLARGFRWERYHAATLTLELHHKETAAYRTNLSNDQPRIFVGLRDVVERSGSDLEVAPFLVTASPFEAQDYLDSSEEIIEGVPMPESLIALTQAFVDAHHIDEQFEKRKQKRLDPNEVAFGRKPAGAVHMMNGRGGFHD
jgi:hypothetical protein